MEGAQARTFTGLVYNLSMVRRKLSNVKNFFKWLLIVLVALIALGFIYEQASEYIDAKILQALGQMVQIDDHKMHIYCTGENINGSATVILEAGSGDNYTTWHRIQPEISNYTKVCSYDRSGLGFSEATNDQRTNDDVVNELETLLKNANVNGPYIMVGHSTGGFYTRLFTARNRSQVVGLIQIDPSVEQMATFENDPTPLIMTVQSDIIEFLFRIGVARIVMHFNPKIANIDKDIANVEIAFKSTMLNNKNKYPDGYKTFDNIQQIESASNFGDLRVVVLSADQSQRDAINAFGLAAENWHSELTAKLSNNSQFIIIKDSGHYIQKDQPQIVINSIVKSF